MQIRFIDPASVYNLRCRKRTAHYTDIANGLFTKPVKLSARQNVWPEHEVTAIQEARLAGKSDDEIRELVKRLEDKRQELLASNLLLASQ